MAGYGAHHLGGLYLKTNESLQSDTNATIIARLLSLLQATTHPYVIVGDWQSPPSSIASTVLPAKFHFDILAPDHSVLSGNVIDYGLLRNSLAGNTALTTDWAIPLQELQTKLAEEQKTLKSLSEDCMKAANQTPAPADLVEPAGETEQIPMAVEFFAHSLGISLTEEQKSQLHGLLKRPNQDPDDPTKRRKTDATAPPKSGHCG